MAANSAEYYKQKIINELGKQAVEAYQGGFSEGMKLQQEIDEQKNKQEKERFNCIYCENYYEGHEDKYGSFGRCEKIETLVNLEKVSVDAHFGCKYFKYNGSLPEEEEEEKIVIPEVGKNENTAEYKSKLNEGLGILGE